jgi:hypothetical protein
VNINVSEIAVNELVDLSAGTNVHMICNTATGTEDVDAGAVFHIIRAHGDSTFGGTIAAENLLENVIVVRSASQLSGTIDSTKAYLIDGIVDMGSTSIEVPAGGINIRGITVGVSKLISSENNYTMFTSPVGGSGGVIKIDMIISVTGTSSQVYDLTDVDGTNIIRLGTTDFVDCTSLGELTGYFTGLETSCARFGGSPSLTFSGAWAGGYRQQTCIVAQLDSGFAGSVFTEGDTFTMVNRFLTDVSCDLPASAAFCDFQPSNFANPSTVVVREAQFSRNGSFDSTDSNIFTNLVASDLASNWMNNKGIPNTFPGGLMSITTEVDTTINTINVFETLAGTWTATDLQHFDQPSNGQLRHLGDFPVEYSMGTSFIIEGTSGDAITIRLRKFDSSATSTSTLFEETRSINSFQGPADAAFFNILRNFTLDNQDYVFWEVANGTGTDTVTATDAARFLVGAR